MEPVQTDRQGYRPSEVIPRDVYWFLSGDGWVAGVVETYSGEGTYLLHRRYHFDRGRWLESHGYHNLPDSSVLYPAEGDHGEYLGHP